LALSNQHRNLSPDFQLNLDVWDDYSDVDLQETARAVTGADGHFLADGIDLSSSIDPPASQVKEPPKLSTEKPWNPRGMPELNPIQPPRHPLRVRNTVTGHEFAWHPLLTLSENDDLEIIF
jgi:hypothetical protein